jgi:hypothetical protein
VSIGQKTLKTASGAVFGRIVWAGGGREPGGGVEVFQKWKILALVTIPIHLRSLTRRAYGFTVPPTGREP